MKKVAMNREFNKRNKLEVVISDLTYVKISFIHTMPKFLFIHCGYHIFFGMVFTPNQESKLLS
jgi:hypothetical protein